MAWLASDESRAMVDTFIQKLLFTYSHELFDLLKGFHENSAQGPQTVHDLPTKVDMLAWLGWVPQKTHNGRSNEFFKAHLL
jgi:hypothetical protein